MVTHFHKEKSALIASMTKEEENPDRSLQGTSEMAGSAPASFLDSETPEAKPPEEEHASVKKTRRVRPFAKRPEAKRHLTTSQKAEAVALWRTGAVTLDDLSKRFGKRPETMSKLFKRMGVTKGSDAVEHTKRIAASVETKILTDIEEHARRVAMARDEHYKMSSGLAKMAWAEIVRARQAGLKIEGLKETMQTLRLASEVVGNVRKELWTILKIEDEDKKKEFEDLPELTVRELHEDEISQLQGSQEIDELGGDEDMGASMVPGEESS